MIFGGGERGGSLRDHDGSNDASHTTSIAVVCGGKMRVGHREVKDRRRGAGRLPTQQRQRASVRQRIVKFVLE